MAARLAGEGWEVFGCSREAVDWSADGYTHVEANVTEEADVKRLIGRATETGNGLYAVVNCAGAASMNHALLTPGSTLDNLLATNVRGTFLVCREAAKKMRKAGEGRIVNISSVAVPMRLHGQAAYVASKAAVERLSQVLAVELAEYGITVNVVGPGPTLTEMNRGVREEILDRLVDAMPIKRLGTLEDVANVVEFFLRPESDAVSGQVIYLGGVAG